ncbi:hypothetical protein K2X33_00185 [bacterium]|nr:hypothetical protein [bacterium]
MNARGMTLIELIAAGAIVLLVAVGMSYAFKQATLISSNTATKVESTQDLNRLVGRMMRVGRIARANGCTISRPPASETSLTCWVDMKSPPTEILTDDTQVKFRLDAANRQVLYQVWENTQFVTKDRFANIITLNLCDDAAMHAPVACEMNDAITVRHDANRTTGTFRTDAGRYFRFRVGAEDKVTIGNTGQGKMTYMLGAFYVRHPTSVSTLRYQFGMRE